MENKKIRVAINGFGRIGRLFFKLALKNENLEVVAINDLGNVDNLAYLLKYDSAQKDLNMEVDTEVVSDDEKYIVVGDQKIKYFSVRNPEELPWGENDIDVVAECTGLFTSFEKSNAHLMAGAKRVVISGPTSDENGTEFAEGKIGSTVLMGVNDDVVKTCAITSNASCTTNAAGGPLDILNHSVGVESALLNTIHSYTATQSIVDSPARSGKKKDWRKGRAGAVNIIPTSTGSAIATTKAVEGLDGKFDGIAVRVPVVSGSLVDITFIAKRETTAEEINEIFRKAKDDFRYKGLVDVTDEEVVSSDIIGNTHVATIDSSFTRVVNGNLVKILAWYDNEAGYSHALTKQVEAMGHSISDK